MKALVTGGTAGIGWHIAAALARSGVNVIITGRDPTKGKAAAAGILAEFMTVDHASLCENAAIAARLRDVGEPLDILVNNVGGNLVPTRTTTAEGHELVLALNYLGPVTLTDGLLPLLRDGVHIVNVLSSAYTMVKGDPFAEPERHIAIKALARAKQLHLLATLSLARRLSQQARVNAVNPGMAWTPGTQALTPAAVPAWRFIWPVVRFVQRRASAERAAIAPITWARQPRGTGQYVESDGKPRPIPDRLTDHVLQDRAWSWPLSLTG